MPAAGPDPVVAAATYQQSSELNAFLARPSLPASVAAAARDPREDEEAAAQQCTASASAGTVSGSAVATHLPMSVIRPPFDWWR